MDVTISTSKGVSGYTYEDLLGNLQAQGDADNQKLLLDSIEAVLRSMDDEMRGYRSLPWAAAWMSGYHTFFSGLGNGVVFTLNHDLWFERFIANGVVERLNVLGQDTPGTNVHPTVIWDGTKTWEPDEFIPSEQHCTIDAEALNIVKLHGSLNWHDGSGRVLVMGADKAKAIEDHSVLRCLDNLKDRFLVTAKRIMIYGYSFGDAHINEALVKAFERGAEFYVFDILSYPHFIDRLKSAMPPTLPSRIMAGLRTYSSLGELVFRKSPRYDLNNPGVIDQRLHKFLPQKFSVGSMPPRLKDPKQKS